MYNHFLKTLSVDRTDHHRYCFQKTEPQWWLLFGPVWPSLVPVGHGHFSISVSRYFKVPIRQGATIDGGGLLMEDELWWKTTFDWRWLLMEEDLWWKTSFDGRQPLMKMTSDGWQTFMEDDLSRVFACLDIYSEAGHRNLAHILHFSSEKSLLQKDWVSL